MSTTHVLVKWDTNWADEMDIAGFAIMERKTWNEYKENLRKKKHPFSICIGTNEEIEYDSGADLLEELTGKNIEPEERAVIKKFFGETGGFTDFLGQDFDEDDDDDEYEGIDLDYVDEDED